MQRQFCAKAAYYFEKFYYLLLVVLFLPFPIATSYDGAWYHKYSAIFEGSNPWSNWDYVRGITYPGLLALMHIFLGYSVLALSTFSLLVFLLSSVFFEKILCHFGFSKQNARLIFLAALVANGYFFGYMHVLLTENVFMTASLAFFYFLFCRDNRSMTSAVLLGLACFLFYQLKDNYLFLIAPLLPFYFRSLSKADLKRLALFLVTFVICTKTCAWALKTASGSRAPSAGYRVLMLGTAVGGMMGSFSNDVTAEQEFVTKIEFADGKDQGCWISNQTDLIYKMTTAHGMLICPFPKGIVQALTVRAYITYQAGARTFVDYARLLAEEIGIIKNRYNDNDGLGLRPVRFVNGITPENVDPVPDPPEFDTYVAPYALKAKPFGSLVGSIFGWLAPLSRWMTALFLTLSLFVFLASLKRSLRSQVGLYLAFAIFFFMHVSLFLGAINERYIFSCYPLAVVLVSIYARQWLRGELGAAN